jgi:hypothetical protein
MVKAVPVNHNIPNIKPINLSKNPSPSKVYKKVSEPNTRESAVEVPSKPP